MQTKKNMEISDSNCNLYSSNYASANKKEKGDNFQIKIE